MTYKQPSWEEAIATLSGGPPADIIDLQAVVEHLREIGKRIGTENIDAKSELGHCENSKPLSSLLNRLGSVRVL